MAKNRPSPETANLRTRVVQVCDQARVSSPAMLTTSRATSCRASASLLQDYKKTVDWSAFNLPTEGGPYTSRTTYDALNRP